MAKCLALLGQELTGDRAQALCDELVSGGGEGEESITEVRRTIDLMGAVGCGLLAACAAGLTMGVVSLDEVDLRVKARCGSDAEKGYALRLLPLIEHGERSLTIYRYMAESPEFFFQLIKTVFRAEGEAPSENASEAEISSATQSFRLLMNFDTLPGATDEGVDSDVLSAWVDTVRALGRENGRAPITDQYVGHALAHSTQVEPFWPGPVVAAEIERAKSEDVETGVRIERFNKRGVTTRGMDDGGQQERDLADQYAAWAAAAKSWPRTQRLLKAMEATWRHDAEREDREVRLRNARDV